MKDEQTDEQRGHSLFRSITGTIIYNTIPFAMLQIQKSHRDLVSAGRAKNSLDRELLIFSFASKGIDRLEVAAFLKSINEFSGCLLDSLLDL